MMAMAAADAISARRSKAGHSETRRGAGSEIVVAFAGQRLDRNKLALRVALQKRRRWTA